MIKIIHNEILEYISTKEPIFAKIQINWENNIISELKPNIESILVTYILDLSNLLNNKLFGNDYLIRYENLKVANERISQIIKKYEIYGENIYNELEKLKYLLLQL